MRPISSRSARPKAPRVGRPPGSFTQNRRLAELRRALENEPRGLTLDELARVLGVTQRSVRRYLRAYDGTKDDAPFETLDSVETTPGGPHLWRIKPGERGRNVQLRRAQAYAILATRRALDVLRGSALYEDVDLALAQIAKIAETPFRASPKGQISGESGLEDRFFWLPPAPASYAARGEDLDELFRAVADLRVVRFRPRTRGGEARADRVVFHPYAMVVHEGVIHVLGSRIVNARAVEPEVVAIDAMTEIRASETEHFELPASFDMSQYVHGEFGVARPSKARVIVEFDARVAEAVRAKKLHPQQRVATSPDGRVRVSLPFVAPDRLVAWILSWGDAARVVEPADVAQRVAATLERAAARYRA
jgi:predicted DNA-binding transcriptional regulator YafY